MSARPFEQAGFPALATTSRGGAVLGYPDGQHIRPSEMLTLVGASPNQFPSR